MTVVPKRGLLGGSRNGCFPTHPFGSLPPSPFFPMLIWLMSERADEGVRFGILAILWSERKAKRDSGTVRPRALAVESSFDASTMRAVSVRWDWCGVDVLLARLKDPRKAEEVEADWELLGSRRRFWDVFESFLFFPMEARNSPSVASNGFLELAGPQRRKRVRSIKLTRPGLVSLFSLFLLVFLLVGGLQRIVAALPTIKYAIDQGGLSCMPPHASRLPLTFASSFTKQTQCLPAFPDSFRRRLHRPHVPLGKAGRSQGRQAFAETGRE
jgi:hypothetical protein